MNPLNKTEIRNTGVHVTRVGMGGAPLAGLYTSVAATTAVETVRRAHELGIGYFDTAPLYGSGRSEMLFGDALQTIPRGDYVLSTKVGRLLEPVAEQPESDQFVDLPSLEPTYDYSRDGVLRSIDESLGRLRLDRVDIVMIHDPDDHFEQTRDEAFPALYELRSQGVVGAIGAGMNQWEMLARFAPRGRPRLLPAGGPVHPARPVRPRRAAADMRGEGHRHRPRRALQQRHPRVRPLGRHDIQLPAGPARRTPEGPQHQGGLRPPRGSAEGCGPTVRAGPPGGCRDHSWRALNRGARGEPEDGGPSHTLRPVGGATERGPYSPRRARALNSADTTCLF